MVPVSDLSLGTDMNEERLKVAKDMGADSTILIGKGETPEETAKRVVAAIGLEPHATIDCAGFQSTITVGLLVCAHLSLAHTILNLSPTYETKGHKIRRSSRCDRHGSVKCDVTAVSSYDEGSGHQVKPLKWT